LFRIRFRLVAIVTVSLPFFAFIFCIVYSFFFHYDLVTKTHCNVWNWAPSISASIGHYAPQRFIWKISIALHSAPRLLFAQMYNAYMYKHLSRSSSVQQMLLLCSSFNIAEIFSLLLLSLVPSKDDFGLHKFGFGSFLLFSAAYISSSYVLFSNYRKTKLSSMERKSMQWKKNLLTTNFTAIVLALYIYWRHNKYCEPGMYSVFSVLEYTVVITNMMYHSTAYWDFHDMHITIGTDTDDIKKKE